MKTTNRIIRIFMVLLITGFAVSCSPEDGKDGVQGEQGPPGQNGNANVVSRTFIPTQITWTNTTLFGTNYVVADLNMPEITQDIIDNGVVMVYGGFFWGQPWSALPISYYENSRTVYFSYGIITGKVALRVHYSNNNSPTAPGIQFRVVVIEGTAATGGTGNKIMKLYNGYTEEEVRAMSYEELVDVFNLPY